MSSKPLPGFGQTTAPSAQPTAGETTGPTLVYGPRAHQLLLLRTGGVLAWGTSPNPCTGSTVVHYRVERATKDASLVIRRSLDGQPVQRVALPPAADNYALDLRGYEPGLYFYTLLADGVPVQTQRLLVN